MHSSLVNYISLSDHKYSPRMHAIDSVAIHTMAGNATIEGCASVFQGSRQCSSNYGIGSDGRIGLYVEEEDAAWTTSNEGVDRRSITIEVASYGTTEPFQPSEAAYESLLNLLVDICKRHNIPGLRWKNDKNYAIDASRGGPVTEQNMFVHRWFANKSCPGEWLFSHHSEIANTVNSRLGRSEVVSTSDVDLVVDDRTPAQKITSEGQYKMAINYQQLTPYIVTLDRNSPDVDYTILKEHGVSGVLLEAGYLFTTNGSVTSFRNPKLYDQIKQIDGYDLPYGYYTICRAKSEKDASSEMEQFAFMIRKYPPKLGVWLRLQLRSDSAEIRIKILDRYIKDLTRLGLKNKIGLYVTEDELNTIPWIDYKEQLHLWVIDHVDNVQELDRLLDPTFFDMEGRYT